MIKKTVIIQNKAIHLAHSVDENPNYENLLVRRKLSITAEIVWHGATICTVMFFFCYQCILFIYSNVLRYLVFKSSSCDIYYSKLEMAFDDKAIHVYSVFNST